jgi:hypothetical protein
MKHARECDLRGMRLGYSKIVAQLLLLGMGHPVAGVIDGIDRAG